MAVSWNGDTPKSSFLEGSSLINQPFWVAPFLETLKWQNPNKFGGFMKIASKMCCLAIEIEKKHPPRWWPGDWKAVIYKIGFNYTNLVTYDTKKTIYHRAMKPRQSTFLLIYSYFIQIHLPHRFIWFTPTNPIWSPLKHYILTEPTWTNFKYVVKPIKFLINYWDPIKSSSNGEIHLKISRFHLRHDTWRGSASVARPRSHRWCSPRRPARRSAPETGRTRSSLGLAPCHGHVRF